MQKFAIILPSDYKKPLRNIQTVFIHCSASDNPNHDNAQTMESWHKARGFAEIGYNIFIRKDGSAQMGRAFDKIPAAQKGHNTGSIAICCHGLDIKKFTDAQRSSLNAFCSAINKVHGGSLMFKGHRDVEPNKTCPVFDYSKWLSLDKWKRKPLT